MRHGTQGHVAVPHGPTRALAWRRGGADAWHGHASPRGRPSGVTWQESQAGKQWVHGLVGPGKSIGMVTQRRYKALHYILTYPTNFLRVGLCSLLCFKLQATWHHVACRIQLEHVSCIDHMDSHPLDHHQITCVIPDRRSPK